VGLIANLKQQPSHKVVDQALRALGCMEHRGACSADDVSGDGSGIMTQIPWKLLKKEFPNIAAEKTGKKQQGKPSSNDVVVHFAAHFLECRSHRLPHPAPPRPASSAV
jgi:glutamate synthase (ferredoxin)